MLRRLGAPIYPNRDHTCPNVNHCPHLGGVALGTVIDAASEQEEYREMLPGVTEFRAVEWYTYGVKAINRPCEMCVPTRSERRAERSTEPRAERCCIVRLRLSAL